MAVLNDPLNPALVARVGPVAARGLHVLPKPIDADVLGHYSWGGVTGLLPAGLAANSEVFQFRWTQPVNVALIRSIAVSAVVSGTLFTVLGSTQLDLMRATGWSAQGTGGTGVTIGASLKRRTVMGNSLLAAGDLRIATTGALGVGTKTLDGFPLATIVGGAPITGSVNPTIVPAGTILYQADVAAGEYPLTLGLNEGFAVRVAAVPATGTWILAVSLTWIEVPAF